MKKLISLFIVFATFLGAAFGKPPTGYTECEYLESTGTQWIDIGYAPYTANLDISVDCELLPNSAKYVVPWGVAENISGTWRRIDIHRWRETAATATCSPLEALSAPSMRFGYTTESLSRGKWRRTGSWTNGDFNWMDTGDIPLKRNNREYSAKSELWRFLENRR